MFFVETETISTKIKQIAGTVFTSNLTPNAVHDVDPTLTSWNLSSEHEN